MSKYRRCAIALDLVNNDPRRLYERAVCLVEEAGLYLVHIVTMDACETSGEFDPACLEQEYWRSDAQLKRCGEDLNVPLHRQALLLGAVGSRLGDFVKDQDISLLVLGTSHGADSASYPVDVLSGALFAADCDLLMVS